MLETNRVVMSSVYSGRVDDAVQRGEPLDIIWDHQVWFFDVWAIPKNGRNTKRAKEFLRFASSTESLAAQARYIPYGPVRKSSMAQLAPELRQRLPTAKEHLATAIELNANWWSENLARITPRFEQWLSRPVMVPKALPR
jgi:putative spermidine/putrescine transport system substrate-binding protein